MASVYVSGDPTRSLIQFKDSTDGYQERDHTYYGLGCPNPWATSDGSDGSDIPCTSTGRIIKEMDGQDQTIGTFFHYQAATAGTGGAMSTQNTNSSDTFCPLGWQLAYSGTGGDYYDKSKSWKYLFEKYGITNDRTGSDKLHSYPFSLIYSGYYHWYTGRLYRTNTTGYWWSPTINSGFAGYDSQTWVGGFAASQGATKPSGYAIRCTKFLASNHRRHGGRKSCGFNSL